MLTKLRQILSYLRLQAFDTNTPEEREQERHRRLAISSLSAFIGQGINYIVMIAMVPLMINYLGRESYGLWIAVSSISTFVVFADLGLGNGLINVLAKADGLNDQKSAREAVSSAFFILTAWAVILGLVGTILIPEIDWLNFFHLSDPETVRQAQSVVFIFFILFVVRLPFSIANKIQMAYQENYLNSIWMAAEKLGMLIVAIFGVFTKQSLLFFVVTLTSIPLFMSFLNNAYLFARHRPWLRPGIACCTKKTLLELLRTGSFFFVTGFAGVLSIQIDTLVIGRFLGAEQVPVYELPLRLFMIATTLLSFVLIPLWPAYREAIICQDFEWVKKTFKRTLFLTFSATLPFVLLLLIIAPLIVQLWTGMAIDIPFSLLIALGIYALMTAVSGPIAMILNGANSFLGVRAILALVGSIINLGLSVFLIRRIGIAGPIFATVIAQLIFSWPMAFYCIRKLSLKEKTYPL
jgi:O-antigen/teichoic acid export membrane protein